MEHNPKINSEIAANKRSLRNRVGRFIGQHIIPSTLVAAGLLAAGATTFAVSGHGSAEAPHGGSPEPGISASTNSNHNETPAVTTTPNTKHPTVSSIPPLPKHPTPNAQEISGKVYEGTHGTYGLEVVDPIISGSVVQDPTATLLQLSHGKWQDIVRPGSQLSPNKNYPSTLNKAISGPRPATAPSLKPKQPHTALPPGIPEIPEHLTPRDVTTVPGSEEFVPDIDGDEWAEKTVLPRKGGPEKIVFGYSGATEQWSVIEGPVPENDVARVAGAPEQFNIDIAANITIPAVTGQPPSGD